mmetsp:Transcript_6969/g.13652  ORF Transcript_6969/g.13652 Transcript_6969/m.13652 type:complete len:132 (+) Transcript_6969:20-415(+)
MEEQIDIYYAFSALLGLVLGYLIKSFFEKEAAPAVKASAATKKGIQKYGEEEWKLRVELAAAYRISSFLGWDEIIYNHISVRIPGRNEFLINAFGLHYDEVTRRCPILSNLSCMSEHVTLTQRSRRHPSSK